MSGGAGTVTLERPATVTVAPGVTITSNMTPEQRSAAIRQSMGLAPADRGKPEGFAYNGPPIAYKDQAATMAPGRPSSPAPTPTQPRENGTAGEQPHAGMTPPTPEELAAGNSGDKLAQFDQEMRDLGIQLPVGAQPGQFQRDERTGNMVDVLALEQCHKLWREMKPEERTSEARQEYHDTLEQIYAGQLQLADMEGTNAPRVEQPRDASGRFAPAPSSGEPAWKSHVEDGEWVGLEHLTTADTSGYTIPQYIPDQRLNVSTFELLKSARAAGITQDQVTRVFHADAVKNGWAKA